MFKTKSSELLVLTDFDRTLTKAFYEGKEVPSIISLLRDGSYLSKDYADKANELYKKYSPIADNPKILKSERAEAMNEWWRAHFELLIESGLSRQDIESIVKNGPIEFRDGFKQFFDELNKNAIPLVIVSSSGCGEAIPMYFRKNGLDDKNVIFIINKFTWKNNVAKGIEEPIIHSGNKSAVIRKNEKVMELNKKRKNILLLGDGIDDPEMLEGLDYKESYKLGFLNRKENLKEEFEQVYDEVLEDDDFEIIINKFSEIIDS